MESELDLTYETSLSPPIKKGLRDPSDDEEEMGPPNGTRLAPVGGNAEDTDAKVEDPLPPVKSQQDLSLKLKQMEMDQEELNSSLIAMTSHFAKVQLRLQQVLAAPRETREALLKELEAFAFRGIPSLNLPTIEGTDKDILTIQRQKHHKLIGQLKRQLEDLESYVYESGEGVLPSNLLLERQRIVMEQLKARLNLDMDNMERLSEDELKAYVDEAVGGIVNPLKMKSHLVQQLKTQIIDLEMFIEFLQTEASMTDIPDCKCKKPGDKPSRTSKFRSRTASEQEEIHKQTVTMLQKTMAVLQLTAISQFGCSSANSQFYKNSLKSTPVGNHYGDLRAKLELSVEHLLDSCSRVECLTDTDCTSLDSEPPEELLSSPAITNIVRKELAVAIRDLMQHGMVERGTGGGFGPFSACMNIRHEGTHIWNVILTFYKLKGGDAYNSAPVRKLSLSYGLNLAAGNRVSAKQSLFNVIGQIIASHAPYKRSPDSQFKAFISAGLNNRQLILWLKLIVKNQNILEYYYHPWSYIAKTGFVDGFHSLERLSCYGFDLPVDAAIKQFQNEAF